MFKISFKDREGLKLCQITDEETGEFISILPEAGCALNNFAILKNGKQLDLIDGYQNAEDLKENMEIGFKGHFLFPFPNRIKGGQYFYNGKKYQLKKNFPQEDNAIHGLLYDKEFYLKEYDEAENSGTLSFFKDLFTEFEGYPFRCSIKLDFMFERRKLIVKSEVVNTGDGVMPVGLGWHPYFQTGTNVSELFLEVGECEQWSHEKAAFSAGDFSGKEPLNGRKLDSCYRLNDPRCIKLTDKKSGLQIRIEPGQDLNYFQIYIPPHGKSIAIEPMTCVPDSFNNKVGLKHLEAGEIWITSWSLKVTEESY